MEPPEPRWSPSKILLVAAMLGVVSFVLYAGRHAALHCDETNVFRHATRFAAGEFDTPGRPGLLWLFLAPIIWLDDPVLVTRLLRLTSSLASGLTLVGVAALATRADGPDRRGFWAGLWAVLLLGTAMSWQGHAYEVRTDTFVVPLCLVAMIQLFRPSPGLKRAVLVGGLIAVTGLISQKSVYNAAALAAGWGTWIVATEGLRGFRSHLREAAVMVVVTVAVMGTWLGLLALINEQGADVVGGTFSVATRTAFGGPDVSLEDKLGIFRLSWERGTALWGLAALAVPWSLANARRRPAAAAVSVALVVMMSTIFVHRGFRTYYVASIEPYAAISGGVLLAWVGRLASRRVPAAVAQAPAAAVLAFAAFTAWGHVRPLLETDATLQFSLMREVHAAFPEPVPYWDMVGLLPGHREVTFLGTGSQRSRFRKGAGRRAVAEAQARGETNLFSVGPRAENRALIERARRDKPLFFLRTYMSRDKYLKKPELAWLWRHYLPYRPNLYLHGGRILLPDGGAEASRDVDLLASSEYTVWFRGGWAGTASVDGVPITHGQVIELSEGRHRLSGSAQEGRGELWLLIGRDRVTRFERPGEQVDFSMFPRDRRDRFQQYDRRRKTNPADLLTPAWDPTMTERKHRARSGRHKKYQLDRHKRYASP